MRVDMRIEEESRDKDIGRLGMRVDMRIEEKWRGFVAAFRADTC
jgi:hypothetical protein